MTQKTLITAEQLLVLCKPKERCELVEGELIAMPPAGFYHSVIAMTIGRLIANHAAKKGLGLVSGEEGGYRLRRNPDTVRVPDVAFVAKEGLTNVGPGMGFARLV